jgi:hypothetical protein
MIAIDEYFRREMVVKDNRDKVRVIIKGSDLLLRKFIFAARLSLAGLILSSVILEYAYLLFIGLS